MFKSIINQTTPEPPLIRGIVVAVLVYNILYPINNICRDVLLSLPNFNYYKINNKKGELIARSLKILY